MVDFSRISGSIRIRGRVERSLRKTFARAVALFSGDSEEPADEVELARRRAFLSLVRTVLESRKPMGEAEIDLFRRLLSEDFSPFKIERMISDLGRAPITTAEEAAPLFQAQPEEDRERLIRLLLILAAGSDCLEESSPLIDDLAARFGFSGELISRMRDEVVEAQRRRMRILRSGAGVLVALIVIAVFILTATLLRSVIFGLIAAYVMLPLEKYFERRLYRKKGIGYLIFRVVDFIYAPLRNLAARLQRSGHGGQPDEAEIRKRAARKIITQAVTLTCGVMLIFVILLVSGISMLTNHYFQNLKGWTRAQMAESSSRLSVAEPVVATESGVPGKAESVPGRTVVPGEDGIWANGAGKLIEQGLIYLERLRERFQSLPLVKWGLDQISRILHDESAQRELAGYLLQRTGGLFSFTAGVIGTIGVVITDLLLAIFFFLLFLMKLAEFCGPGDDPNRQRQSEYLVRTVFNGNWLPGASPETVAEAQRIIGEVINKLRVWVRGYLTLMVVDATVYTTAFFFLGVPYFALLGPLAGCGILLPYIGPILSALVTVLVTLAVGGSSVSGLQLAGIIATYLIYNGVIEQFILYPAVIGESLGLTTLETIIVVLLGAIFAGIPGMILALPAASVIKYLVPQIYHTWGRAVSPQKGAGE